MTVVAPSSAVAVIDATVPLEQAAPPPVKETTTLHKSSAGGGGGGGGSWLTRRRHTRSSAPAVGSGSGNGRGSITVPTEDEEEDDEQEDEEPSALSSPLLPPVVVSHPEKVKDKDKDKDNKRANMEITPSTTTVTPVPRHIRWTTVEIREYAIMLGDNPSVTRGVPLTMGWRPLSSISLDLDAYESRKPQPPRRPHEMIRSASDREDLLLNRLNDMVGSSSSSSASSPASAEESPPYYYTRSMLLQAQRTAYMVRDQRRQTNQMRKWDRLQELLEKVTRTVQRGIGTRPSKQWERAYLELHCGGGPPHLSRSTDATTTPDSTPTHHHHHCQGET